MYVHTIEATGILERAIGDAASREGSQSLIFVFDGFDDTPDSVQFGGIIQDLPIGDPNGGRFVATIRFWNELARIYATKGSTFLVWYGENVGKGHVVRVHTDV